MRSSGAGEDTLTWREQLGMVELIGRVEVASIVLWHSERPRVMLCREKNCALANQSTVSADREGKLQVCMEIGSPSR